MAHEETADLLRSARTKILRNSIFRQRENTEIEFRKNFDRVLPLQGLAAKAGGRLYERHKFGNGSGQLKGALTHGCPAQRCGMLASRLMSASPPSGSMSRPRLVSTVTCGRARLLPTSDIACPRDRHGDRTAAFRLFAISDDAARVGHRLRAFAHSPGSARPSERSLSARYTARSGPASSSDSTPRKSQGARIRARHERNTVKRHSPILRNEMCALHHGLCHEEMIERITVMKRKSGKGDKMRI